MDATESSRSHSSEREGGEDGDCDGGRKKPSKVGRRNLEGRDEPMSSQDGLRKGREDGQDGIASPRTSGHDKLQSIGGSGVEGPQQAELEKPLYRVFMQSNQKASGGEKDLGLIHEEGNAEHVIFDDVDSGRRAEESSLAVRSSNHLKHGLSRERSHDSAYECGDASHMIVASGCEEEVGCSYKEERCVVNLRSERDSRSDHREEEVANREMDRNWGEPDAQDKHFGKATRPQEARSYVVRDDKQTVVRERTVGMEDAEPSACWSKVRSAGEESNKYSPQRSSAYSMRDEGESRERPNKMDEDGLMWTTDRNHVDGRLGKRSRTPERTGAQHIGFHQHNQGISEYENDRTGGARDDRSSKGKDTGWIDKNRDRENPKDHGKITQSRQNTKDADREFDPAKDWGPQRREQERAEEKLQSRPTHRRDARIWSDDMKTSSRRCINEKSDSIEIKPVKNFDFGREESVSAYIGRRTEVGSQQDIASAGEPEEWLHQPEDCAKASYGDDFNKMFRDDGVPMDQGYGRNSLDSLDGRARGQKGPMNPTHTGAGHSGNSYSQSPLGNSQVSGSSNRALQQGPKGVQSGRGRRMTGRDVQRSGTPLPMMGPPFGHLGLPSGPMQQVGPIMSHSPGPHIGSGVFIPPFPGPIVWPGGQGVDMSMLAVPPNLSPIPPGTRAPRFDSSMGYGPNQPAYFDQSGSGRGSPSNSSVSMFNSMTTMNHENLHDKTPTNWGTARNSGPAGKAPSRGEQNDYSQNFVDTGMRPQNFIRELELTSTVEDYPKLRELIQRKDEIVAKSASPPMYHKCDLREFVLTSEFFGTKFDVILVDPPWEEYVHRAPGVTDHLEYWSFEEIQNLKIEAISDTPSFLFLWVGDGVGLEQGRQCLKKWGFRRCEDICWVKTNKKNATPGLRHDSRTLFQHSKEHCLMGIKGTVRRSTDGHIIHANIDTDIVIAEEPPYGSTKKPDDMYRIIEHFALGKRRLELFGEDHNIRSGWLTLGKGLSSSNCNSEAYVRNFCDKDGKVWQGGSGRNPPPETSHLVLTTPEIEGLRPKSPPPKNQLQQPSMSLMTTSSSTNRRLSENFLQTTPPASHYGPNQEASVSQPTTPAPWGSPGLQGPEGGHGNADDKSYNNYRFNMHPVGDHHEFDPRRAST